MMVMPDQQWVFRARLVRVIDGDTIDVTIDQGLHTYRTERLRLLGLNAQEMRGTERPVGELAKAFVVDWLFAAGLDDWPLVVQTYKSDVFGRYLANVWRAVDGACLNDDLISSNNAVVMG